MKNSFAALFFQNHLEEKSGALHLGDAASATPGILSGSAGWSWPGIWSR